MSRDPKDALNRAADVLAEMTTRKVFANPLIYERATLVDLGRGLLREVDRLRARNRKLMLRMLAVADSGDLSGAAAVELRSAAKENDE